MKCYDNFPKASTLCQTKKYTQLSFCLSSAYIAAIAFLSPWDSPQSGSPIRLSLSMGGFFIDIRPLITSVNPLIISAIPMITSIGSTPTPTPTGAHKIQTIKIWIFPRFSNFKSKRGLGLSFFTCPLITNVTLFITSVDPFLTSIPAGAHIVQTIEI